MFSIPDGSFRRFENCTVKVSVRETKLTSLEARTRPTFLETLISKYDFGPVKLPGLSRNGPLDRYTDSPIVPLANFLIFVLFGSTTIFSISDFFLKHCFSVVRAVYA